MSSNSTHHVVPLSIYFAIFSALMILTGVTVWIAFIDLGAMNTPMALAIAVTKALLVILYFMHVRYSSKLTMLVVVSGFAFLAILMVFLLIDPLTRGWLG